MKFSVVIPAKNEQRNITRCLAALEQQELRDFEVVVVDNGSTDATVALAERAGCRVFVKPDLSISGLRNFGAAASGAEIIAFLDADCLPNPAWLSGAAAVFKDPAVGCTGATPVAPEGGTWVERVWSSFRTRRSEPAFTSWINSSNLLVRRELFNRVGGFNESVLTCEDVDVCLRLTRITRILFHPGLRVVHLGEPKTLRQFFMKEIWRGQGGLSGVRSHGFSPSELKSLVLPLYYLAATAALLASLVLGSPAALILSAVCYLFPALVFSSWVINQTGRVGYLPGYLVLFLVYASARTVALFSPTSLQFLKSQS